MSSLPTAKPFQVNHIEMEELLTKYFFSTRELTFKAPCRRTQKFGIFPSESSSSTIVASVLEDGVDTSKAGSREMNSF